MWYFNSCGIADDCEVYILINILLLSCEFEATKYDQSYVDAYRKVLVYQLHANLGKKLSTLLQDENEESNNNSIMEVHEVLKRNITSNYEEN